MKVRKKMLDFQWMEIRNILRDKMAIDFFRKVQGSGFKVQG
jgi:hypothetical protein